MNFGNCEIVLQLKNQSYFKIICEDGILQELADDFTFYAPDYNFHPRYRARQWDGKIRLINKRTKLIYSGLKNKVIEWGNKKGYPVCVEGEEIINKVDDKTLTDFTKQFKLPVRDYQFTYLKECINEGRAVAVSPTGSGKSYLLYLLASWYRKTCLIVVPTVNLVNQMYNDFADYGFDVAKYCDRIYGGSKRRTGTGTAAITISTWQSLILFDESFFEKFEVVIVDEAHGADAKSISKILSACVNAKHRFGFTGTIKDAKTHKLVLEGLFGKIIEETTTSDLQELGYLANLNIKVIILEYPQSDRLFLKGSDYNTETDFIINHKLRQQKVVEIASKLQGSTFVLFRIIDHGRRLFADISKIKGETCAFVFGGTDAEEREEIRLSSNEDENMCTVASYGTFSTGTNVPNLKNILLASPYKSKVKVLQSIGRALRKTSKKQNATVFDIVDDLSVDNHMNYSIKHYLERIKLYNQQKFDYEIIRVPLGTRLKDIK